MKLDTSKIAQSVPAAQASWADVMRESARPAVVEPALLAEVMVQTKARPAAESSEAVEQDFPEQDFPEQDFPGGKTVQPGDQIDHAKFGLCTVHRIVGEFVHMARPNGRTIRLSKNFVTFTPAHIKDGKRIFSTSKEQQ